MTVASAAYAALGLAAASWVVAFLIVPSEDRLRRTGGVIVTSLLAGVAVWLLVFSAGAAFTIARGGGYLPVGEIATAAGATAAAAACIAGALLVRRIGR